METPHQAHFDANIERLLVAHDTLIRTMQSGIHVPNAPSRLMRLNAQIHEAYRSLSRRRAGRSEAIGSARSFRTTD